MTVTRNCEQCGALFIRSRNRNLRFCGRRCAALYNIPRRAPVYGPRKTPTVARNCGQCGASFIRSRRSGARFCGPKCAALWRSSHLSHVRGIKKCEWCGKDFQRVRSSRRFCSLKCVGLWSGKYVPVSKETRNKRSETMRKVISMHNNLPPTIPQKILLDHLPGATLEFRFPEVGGAIDIAIPSLRLAIEVDGQSHRSSRQKEKDVRKEQRLKDCGWTLLRFWNAEILGDLSSVLARIKAQITVLEKAG